MNIFQDSTTKLPKSDAQIKKIDLTTLEVGGRPGHVPTPNKEGDMAIRHVPNSGGANVRGA